MGTRRIEDKNIRKLSKVSGNVITYVITLPIDAILEFGWQEKQKLVIEVEKRRKRLMIKDLEKIEK